MFLKECKTRIALNSSEDYYFNEEGLLVFTREYHLKRGDCCGSGCINCPFDYVNVRDEGLRNRLIAKRNKI